MRPIHLYPAASRGRDKKYPPELFTMNSEGHFLGRYYKQMRRAGMSPFDARSIIYMTLMLGRHARTRNELARETRRYPQLDNAF